MFKYSLNDLMKVLYKEKTMAYLHRYQAGQIFYRFELEGSTYEFGIDTVEEIVYYDRDGQVDGSAFLMSPDLGTTAFGANVRASELSRWIRQRVLVSELKEIL